MAISTEGKIAIGLTLVLGSGAGGVMIAPEQEVWIGWITVIFCTAGLVVLGIYHVATAVAAPKRPILKRESMPLAEGAFFASLIATAVALISAGARYRWTASIAAIIAVLAAGTDFVDRQWFSNAPVAQMALSADNAKLEIQNWILLLSTTNNSQAAQPQAQQTPPPTSPPPQTQSVKQYIANVFTVNKGKHDAIGMRHAGMILFSGKALSAREISAFLPIMKAQFALAEPATKARIEVGSSNVWFSIFSGAVDDKVATGISNSTMLPYVLDVMQYRDDLIAPDKFIYTESCAYFLGGATHICPDGDNNSYISN